MQGAAQRGDRGLEGCAVRLAQSAARAAPAEVSRCERGVLSPEQERGIASLSFDAPGAMKHQHRRSDSRAELYSRRGAASAEPWRGYILADRAVLGPSRQDNVAFRRRMRLTMIEINIDPVLVRLGPRDDHLARLLHGRRRAGRHLAGDALRRRARLHRGRHYVDRALVRGRRHRRGAAVPRRGCLGVLRGRSAGDPPGERGRAGDLGHDRRRPDRRRDLRLATAASPSRACWTSAAWA